MNVKKLLLNVSIFFAISVAVSSLGSKSPDSSLLNTIYTVAGIMFSIGMGILCTLNPDRVKNDAYYKAIKSNLLDVRNSYLVYFFIISGMYLTYQIFPTASFAVEIRNLEIIFNLAFAAMLLNILGILYFISNFIAIQKLGLNISDQTRGLD